MHSLSQYIHPEASADYTSQGVRDPESLVIESAAIQAEEQTGISYSVLELLDIRTNVGRSTFFIALCQ